MRGLTVPIIWFDEFAFIPYVDELYTAASPAVSQASINAKMAGTPTFKLIQTTPNNIDSLPGAYTKRMIEDAAPFTERLYDMTSEEIAEYVEKESTNNFIHIEFTYKQLGRDEKWFRNQCRELNNDRLKIKREILLEFTKASDTAVFQEEELDALENFRGEVRNTIIVHGRPIHFLTDEVDYLKPYLIGVDVAGGLARDYSAITILDPDTKLPVGYFYNQRTDTDDLQTIIQKLINNWLPNQVVIIERNNYGLNIIQRLIKQNIQRNMYFEYVDDPTKQKEGDFREGNRVRIYGFQTSEGSREQIFELLRRIVTYTPDRVIIPTLIKEISTLEYNKKGKIEHSEGCHDDLIFQYMFCQHVMEFQKTIKRWVFTDRKKEARLIQQVSQLNKKQDDITMADQVVLQEKIFEQLNQESKEKSGRKINNNIMNALQKLNKK